MFKILTLVWVCSHVITGLFRFGVCGDRPKLTDYVLFDLVGTYALMWVMAGCAIGIIWIVGI
jgi:hypothetical protein